MSRYCCECGNELLESKIVWEYESNKNAFESCAKLLIKKGVNGQEAIELLERVYNIAMSEFGA